MNLFSFIKRRKIKTGQLRDNLFNKLWSFFSSDNPANVTLLANTTENKDCSDSLWVNFTCVASEKANPAVGSYQLYRNEELISASDSGTWNEEPPEKGEYDYSCLAIHPVKNVRSSNNVTVTFKGEFGKKSKLKDINRHLIVWLVCTNQTTLTSPVIELDSPHSRFTPLNLKYCVN